jgi:hypothetical protein
MQTSSMQQACNDADIIYAAHVDATDWHIFCDYGLSSHAGLEALTNHNSTILFREACLTCCHSAP